MAYRLGVDVGGAFTDLLLIDEETGETFRAKMPTTPANQAAAVLDGIERVCAIAGINPSALAELMHGTTLTTNAVLEGKGARVGLVTTEGYRQILQVARSYVPGGLAGWIIWPKPEPLAALDDAVEVRERPAALHLWGGGGWGDPLQRDAAVWAAEAGRGLMTAAGARRYGVVLAVDSTVDEAATRKLRETIAAER